MFLGVGSGTLNPEHVAVSTGTIYVVSYVPVKEALFDKDRMNILAHIYEYDPESAQALLDAYDALTSQSYMIDVVNSDNVTALANTLCEKVKKSLKALMFLR
ncbi:MAG: hypothetical protein L6V88_03690 [Anaerotruncus sp.]|nr:MAG: hypothetical protein L6V88_03690 [Anaerotruncus sp.]